MKLPNSALLVGASKKKQTGKNNVLLSTNNTNLDPDQLIAKYAKNLLTKRENKELQVKTNSADNLKATVAAECKFVEKKQVIEKDLIAAVKLKKAGFSVVDILEKYPNISRRHLYRAVDRINNNECVVGRDGRPKATLSPKCKTAIEEARAKLQSDGTGFVFKNFEKIVKTTDFPKKKKFFAKKTLKRLMRTVVPAPTNSSHVSTAARQKAKQNICNYISWGASLLAMFDQFKKEAEERLACYPAGTLLEKVPFFALQMVSNIDSTSVETSGLHTIDKAPQTVWTTEEFKAKARASGQAISKPPPVTSPDGKTIFISQFLSDIICKIFIYHCLAEYNNGDRLQTMVSRSIVTHYHINPSGLNTLAIVTMKENAESDKLKEKIGVHYYKV